MKIFINNMIYSCINISLNNLKMEYMKDLTMVWILKCAMILYTATAVGGNECIGDIETVTSECLTTYANKVHHMQRNHHNFYTGVDVEEMRSLCSAMRHAITCITSAQENCPDLAEPVYPSDLVAVYQLCHTDNFYEVYAMNQFCYANQKSSTQECHQRFDTRTSDHIDSVMQDNPAAVQQYCSELEELVRCVWALVGSKCGAAAGGLVEALVRPAVSYSDKCTQPPTSTTTFTNPPTTSPVLYQYKDHGDTKNSDNAQQQENTDSLLENGAISLQFSYSCQLLFSFFVVLILQFPHL